MANRITLGDCMASRLPQAVGLCAVDTAGVAAIVNSAQQRILFARELGDVGWFGGWSELSFDVSQDDPYITLPRGYTSIIAIDICTAPIPLRNQFFEFMLYGFGRFPKGVCASGRSRNSCASLQTYDRGFFPSFTDVIPPDKKLRFYLTDSGDVGKRVLVGYKDANGIPVRTLDGVVQVDGEFLTLVAPFVDTTYDVSVLTSLQKDITLGRVTVFQVDVNTAEETQISYLEPGETVAGYRRYLLDPLPRNCCNLPQSTSTTVQVKALCRLDYIPAVVTTDFLVVSNLEAITNEAQAIRYSQMDIPNAKQMEEYHHKQAIRLLQGQIVANEGTQTPSIRFSPFGSAHLLRQGIGINF